MIDAAVIRQEVAELEAGPTDYRTCERLAWLYTVLDHIPHGTGAGDRGAVVDGASEFLRAARAADYDELLSILDKHMMALATVSPREYEAVMQMVRRAARM